MQLQNLDLNLIISLEALLTERSVSRAADRLGRSQPSLSAALARLRRHFSDELLARVGNHYELTPLGAQLRPLCVTALATAERLFSAASQFDPAASRREFTVISMDYMVTAMGPAITRAFARENSAAALRFVPFTLDLLDRARRRAAQHRRGVPPAGDAFPFLPYRDAHR